MSTNFLTQDIYIQKEKLFFTPAQSHYRKFLISFTHDPSLSPTGTTTLQSTLFQIVDIRDISRSAIWYIEALTQILDINEGFYDRNNFSSAVARKTNTPVVIRSVNVDDIEGETASNNENFASSMNLYKLTLQDGFGNLIYAFEAEPLHILRKSNNLYPISLGSKLVVHLGTKVVFNTLMLENGKVEFLGGELPKLNYNLYRRKLEAFKREIEYKD